MIDPARFRPTFSVRSYADGVALHAHGHAQAVLPLHGTMALAAGDPAQGAGGWEGVVQDGIGVLVPAGLAHRFGSAGPNRFVVLDFDCMAARGSFFAVDAPLTHLLRYIQDIAGGDRDGCLAPDVRHHATALLCDAVRGRAGAEASAVRRRALDPALALMAQRFAEPLRVADIAAAAGLSVSHLHAEFKRCLGTSPARHLADLRMQAAVAQLRGTALPIAQIALDCGFSEQSALTRALRRTLGTTPTSIRRAAPPASGAAGVRDTRAP